MSIPSSVIYPHVPPLPTGDAVFSSLKVSTSTPNVPLPRGTGSLTGVPPFNVNSSGVALTKGSADQETSITTAVEVNSAAGVITTQAAATAAGATDSFEVSNTEVKADSTVVLQVVSYAGTPITNGIPVVSTSGVADGSFNVNITNYAAANALSGVFVVNFAVL